MSNNAAERAVRCVAVGRKNWTFAGSDEGGHRAAAIYTLIETCRCSKIRFGLRIGWQAKITTDDIDDISSVEENVGHRL
jgi:Transposase IS66 family